MTGASASGRRVVDNEERERFELLDGDEVVGYVNYGRRPGVLALMHTEVDPNRRGEGLAGELVSAALDSARDDGLAVLPFCSYVNRYIKAHDEYAALVPQDFRSNFDL